MWRYQYSQPSASRSTSMLPWLAVPLSMKIRRTVASVAASSGRSFGTMRSLPWWV